MAKILDILDCQGTKVGEYQFPEGAFELEKGAQAVHDAVVAYRASLRAGTAMTKTRGLVRGGGAKPFRQKGMGRARAGSNRSPVWVGGGTIFGPVPRSFAKKVNKKVLQLALKRAVSERIEAGDVVVVDDFKVADHKTKSSVAVFKNLQVADNTVLLTVNECEETVCRSVGNLPNVMMRTAACVNTYELLRCSKVIFTKDALDVFVGRLAVQGE